MNAQPATHFDALAILNGDAPIYVREAYDNLMDLVSDADADYVILRNSFEEGSDAQVVTFGEPWSLGRRQEISFWRSSALTPTTQAGHSDCHQMSQRTRKVGQNAPNRLHYRCGNGSRPPQSRPEQKSKHHGYQKERPSLQPSRRHPGGQPLQQAAPWRYRLCCRACPQRWARVASSQKRHKVVDV